MGNPNPPERPTRAPRVTARVASAPHVHVQDDTDAGFACPPCQRTSGPTRGPA
jgi:hypothetical protein